MDCMQSITIPMALGAVGSAARTFEDASRTETVKLWTPR